MFPVNRLHVVLALAQLDDATLPDCSEVDDETSCASADEPSVRVVGLSFELGIGDAEMLIESAEAQTYLIGVASAAWGPWNEATELKDLDPDIPSPGD